MKAYKIFDNNDYIYSLVVFAETPSKAKTIALYRDGFEDSEYTDLRARRIESLDKYYKQGKDYLDWYIDEDKLALVKDAGFSCYDPYPDECKSCIAREYCEYMQEQEEEAANYGDEQGSN